MTVSNQKPFSWSENTHFRDETTLRGQIKPIAEFSKNIKGICITCGLRVQKVRKNKPYCPQCLKRGNRRLLLKLPVELLPWKIKNSPKNTYRGAFDCEICGTRNFSYAIMGSICSHKNHQPEHYVCRLCCQRISTKKVEEPTTTETPELFTRAGRWIGTTIPMDFRLPAGTPLAQLVFNPMTVNMPGYNRYEDELRIALNTVQQPVRRIRRDPLLGADTFWETEPGDFRVELPDDDGDAD